METIKNWNWKQWVIVVLCAFGVYALYKMFRGGNTSPNLVKIKNADGTTTEYNPAPITDALYNDITSWFGSRNLRPYQQLVALPDAKFKVVFSDWAKRYAGKYGMLLGAAIAAEWDSVTNTPNNITGSFSSLKQQIAVRVEKSKFRVE